MNILIMLNKQIVILKAKFKIVLISLHHDLWHNNPVNSDTFFVHCNITNVPATAGVNQDTGYGMDNWQIKCYV